MVHDGAQGRDDGSGAAQAGLGEVTDFAEGHGALLHFHAQILLVNILQRAAGDGGQDGVGLGGDQGVALDEDDVGAAGLLDVGAGGGVHIHVLVVALLVGIHDVVKAHGVVQASLYVAGAPGGCTVQIGDAHGQGLHAALEVGANGGGEDTELVLIGGLDADDGIGAEHEGTDVQGCAGAEGGHPGGVGTDGLHNGVHELVLGEHGHLQTLAGLSHPGGVQVGAEADDAAVFGGVGLHALKAGLGVLQHAGALTDGDGGVLSQAALVPGTVLVVGDEALIGLDVAKPQAAPVDIFLFHGKHLSNNLLIFPFYHRGGGRSIGGGEKMFFGSGQM